MRKHKPFKRDLQKLLLTMPNIGDGKIGIIDYYNKTIKLVCLRIKEQSIIISVSIIEDDKEILVKDAVMTFDVLAELIGGEREDWKRRIVLVTTSSIRLHVQST